jgi:hypothetical protein
MMQDLFSSLARPLAAVFAVAALAACGAAPVLAQQSDSAYIAKRISAIPVPKLPAKIRPGTVGARTYLYWHKAAGEIGLCLDYDTINRDRGFMGRYGVGSEIIKSLPAIPTEGVDPAAVRTVRHLAQGIETIGKINREMAVSAGKAFISMLEGIFGGGAAAAMETAKDAASAVSNLSDAVPVYKNLKGLHEVGWAVQDELDATRAMLSGKYGDEFPRIYILELDPLLKRPTIFNNVAGYCRMIL